MVDIKGKAFRHSTAGRVYPGRGFLANDLQYPSNFLECATEAELREAGITIDDDETMTPEDVAKETEYQRNLQRREGATKEQFEWLGRFVQAFELMVSTVRIGCIMNTSFFPKHQQLMNIVFHHQAMSADALFSIFRAIITTVVTDPESQVPPEEQIAYKGVLQQISTEYCDLCSERNKMLHGTWRIGWYYDINETEFEKVFMHKGNVSKDGFRYVSPVNTVEDLKAVIKRCDDLEDMIGRVNAIFGFRQELRISRNFQKVGGRWKTVQPSR